MGMLPVIAYAAIAGTAGYFNPVALPGEPGYHPVPEHQLRGVFQNDSISGDDSNFSHGTRIDYVQAMQNGDAWGVSLTQNMYTPEIHTRGNVYNQHPYCGYLAFGGAYLLRGERFGCVTELQLGTTGRASLAGQTQNAVHKMLGMDEWEGWHDQVRSELTMQLTSRQEWLVNTREFRNGWECDLALRTRESVGTFNLSGGVGMAYRVGRNLPPTMSSCSIDGANFGTNALLKPHYDRSKMSYFLLASASGEYVARDMSIDGGVFHHFDRVCSRKPWQVQGQLGAGVAYEGIDYFAGVLMRSRTYRTQDKASVMGVFSVAWNW